MNRLQSQAVLRRKLRAAERKARRTRRIANPALPAAWFLTDPQRTPDPQPRGRGVIYRHFGSDDRLDLARQMARLCRRRGLILLVSVDPDPSASGIGRSARAHGAHWPEKQLSGAPIRVRLRQRQGLVTASAHSRRALAIAARNRCDAALLSAVFPTRSAKAPRPMGGRGFLGRARSSPLPVLALGGVNAGNAMRAFAEAAPMAAGWGAIESVWAAWGPAEKG